MTREKKEVIKKLNEIDRQEEMELELGCGFGYELICESFQKLRAPLLERLAVLQHYQCVNDMLYDFRGCV